MRTNEMYLTASRRGKIKRSCEDIDRVSCSNKNEMTVKDAVMQVYERKTRYITDAEARFIANQLAIAFKTASEAY